MWGLLMFPHSEQIPVCFCFSQFKMYVHFEYTCHGIWIELNWIKHKKIPWASWNVVWYITWWHYQYWEAQLWTMVRYGIIQGYHLYFAVCNTSTIVIEWVIYSCGQTTLCQLIFAIKSNKKGTISARQLFVDGNMNGESDDWPDVLI